MFIVEDLSFWPSLFSPFVSVLMLENQLWEVFLLPPLLCLSFAVAVVLINYSPLPAKNIRNLQHPDLLQDRFERAK